MQVLSARELMTRKIMLRLFQALVLAALMAAFIITGCEGPGEGAQTPETDTSTSDEPAICHTPTAADTETSADNNGRVTFETLSFPAPLPNPPKEIRLPILMFHHIGDAPSDADEIRRNLTVSAADFEAMMAYLKQAGYTTVSEKQLFKTFFSAEALPAKPVMLTLDDGYLDNYLVAAPILEKYGLQATFYIVTELVGTPEYMSWEQVAALDSKGMDIGSHTCAHLDLTDLSGADLKHELTDSAASIQAHLDHPVYWLCYPAGKFDADVELYAREGGYLLATTTNPGEQQSSNDPYGLLRYRVRSDTGLAGFMALVE